MFQKYLNIAWTAQPLSAEQIFVLRNIAVIYLKGDHKRKTVNFTHELIEGKLTCKSEGLFVTFVGTFFHADLGLVNGERWSVDFLIPRGAETIELDPNQVVIGGRFKPDGSTDERQIDRSLTGTTEASLFD